LLLYYEDKKVESNCSIKKAKMMKNEIEHRNTSENKELKRQEMYV